jgi:diguanylate cyclase (GGDEF)-like protein
MGHGVDAGEGRRMGQPHSPALSQLAGRWLRGVTTAGFVPGPRARARQALEDVLDQVIAAVRAEPFDPAAGHRIGTELVRLRMSAPEVLGVTVEVLGEHLPGLVGDVAGDAQSRVLRLLGQLASGFATEQRRIAVAAAEQINSAYRKHWHGQHTNLQEKLRRAALHDARTGLPNRAGLAEYLAAAAARPDPARVGICLLSIDRFADINDALGHEHGVRLLQAAATRLGVLATERRCFLAHTADDQFTLAVADTTDADELAKTADLAIRTLRSPVVIDGHDLRLAVTAGIVEAPAGTQPEGWLRDAHLALQGARRDRREYGVFDPDRAAQDLRRQRLAAIMPAALELGEFVPHFQPLYRLGDRGIVGVEALARWHLPDGTVLGPQHFITLAEQTGLIQALGRHLLEQACRRAVAWRAHHPGLLLSVNLSPWQLSDPGLLGDVENTLRATGLPATNLQLEITESAAVEDHHDALNGLADLGIRLAIDDLGTGYSAVADLPDLPISGVKLAAELLPRDATDHVRRTILGSLIDLCHALGIRVTGEGIETPAHERLLRELGCDYGQGFLFARPVTADEITCLLTRPVAG